jgi:hypothetical protein
MPKPDLPTTWRNWTLAVLMGTSCLAAQAGRPLVVDDASVNETGHGHLELWAERAGGATMWNLSPAYGFAEGLELAGLFGRESGGGLRVTVVQVKWRITPSQPQGCNFAAAGGVARATLLGVHSTAPYVTGLMSCSQGEAGSLHMNVGYAKPSDASGETSWGIA